MARFTAYLRGHPDLGVYKMKHFDKYIHATEEEYFKAKASIVNELLPDLSEKDVERLSEIQWNPPVVFKYKPGLFG